MLALALLVVPATLGYEAEAHAHAGHVLAAAIGMSVVAVLVLARLADLLRAEIDARREAEAMQGLLELQNRSLQDLDRMKDEFVSAVSHELRTPLTSISGYTDLLQEEDDGRLDEEQRRYLTIVSRNTNRLLVLVNDLLFAAGLQDGKLHLHREPVDLAAVARDAVAAALPRARDKGIDLVLDIEGAALVDGDPGRLAQLLDNLVSNAVKFTPENGRVSVAVGAALRGGSVVLEVADSGIGIPAAELDRLFQRFFRASTAIEGAIPGTGLGLFITRSIVEAHGGRIEVESEEGQGTRFAVTLPAAALAVADPQTG